MASLIVYTSGQPLAGTFKQRVLFGRKPFNGVQFGLRAISRVHAWIDQEGASYYIADAASRSGTTVNGIRVNGKVTLKNGDIIGIGPERMEFRLSNKLPMDAITFLVADNGTNPEYIDSGILIQCSCGAPLWVPQSMAGCYGHCVHCKAEINVPGEPQSGVRHPLTPNDSLADMPAIQELGSTAAPDDPLSADMPRPKPKTERVASICGVCHKSVQPLDAATDCPACGQAHHEQCWTDNGGCASYGCVHAGMMLPTPMAAAPPEETGDLVEIDEALEAPAEDAGVEAIIGEEFAPAESERRSWDAAVLVGSLFGTILGAITFGVPALAMCAATSFLATRRGQRTLSMRIAAVSTAISVLGVAIGVFTSIMLWFKGPFSFIINR